AAPGGDLPQDGDGVGGTPPSGAGAGARSPERGGPGAPPSGTLNDQMAEQEPVIGIDLGTTNSVVAHVQGGQPQVIRNRSGQTLTPWVVALTAGGKRLVGNLAKRQAITNPENTVYASKRLIGRKYNSEQIRRAREVLSYRVVCGEHDDVRVQLGDKAVSLPEISAAVLRGLKRDAEGPPGRTVT